MYGLFATQQTPLLICVKFESQGHFLELFTNKFPDGN